MRGGRLTLDMGVPTMERLAQYEHHSLFGETYNVILDISGFRKKPIIIYTIPENGVIPQPFRITAVRNGKVYGRSGWNRKSVIVGFIV